MSALDKVLDAARRRLSEIGSQASKYEDLANRAGEPTWATDQGQRGIASETMREHYTPLKEAIEEVEGGGWVEREAIVEALRAGHRRDSAADQVEFVSDLVGWSAEDDEEAATSDN